MLGMAIGPRRRLVVAADAISTQSLTLARLWTELTAGELKVVDSFVGKDRCFLVLTPRAGGPEPRLSRGDLEVLRRVLVVGRMKCVSIDLKRSPATTSIRCARALRWLGLSCSGSGAPYILTTAARESTSGGTSVARTITVAVDDAYLRVVSLPRPELGLMAQLPPALAHVAELFVAGRRREQIAAERKTSQRTVANQLSAIFALMRVTNRLDLLAALETNASEGVVSVTWRAGSSPHRSHSTYTSA